MAIQLDEDRRMLDSAQALIAALAKADIPSDKLLDLDVPKEIEKLFNTFSKTAYQNKELSEHVDGFTFWGLVEWALTYDYDNWRAKPDRDSAARFLKTVSANLKRATAPKLLIVPVRMTRIQAPIQIKEFLIVPPQGTEKDFVATIEAAGFKTAKIRDGLFEHMERTTGHNLTHRPLVIMFTKKDQYMLKGQFHEMFVRQIFPVLRMFDDKFSIEGPPATLEIMSGDLSEHVYSSVVLNLEDGEMRREGLQKTGGELFTGLTLSPERLQEFRANRFDNMIEWLYTSKGNLSKRVRNALAFYSRALDAKIQSDELSAFIFAVIALESLFSRDPGVPLRATLADSIALLTESTVKDRLAVSQRMRYLYDRRSQIVHAGNDHVARDDLRDSLKFCSRSLFEILTQASTWGDVPDADLFSEIDRRKFS
jgi:hypothetical protein